MPGHADKLPLRGVLIIWLLILNSGTWILLGVPNQESWLIGCLFGIVALAWKMVRQRHFLIGVFANLGFVLFLLTQEVILHQSLAIPDFGFKVILFLNMAFIASIYFRDKDPLTLILSFERVMAVIIIYGFASYGCNYFFPSNDVLFFTSAQDGVYTGSNILFPQLARLLPNGAISVLNEYNNFKLRGHSIYWEPGNYAVFLTISLLNQALILKNTKRMVVTALALLLTYSTNGLLGLFLALLFWTWRSGGPRKPHVLILGGVGVLFAGPIVYQAVISKIALTGSGLVRVANTMNMTSLLLEHPILGVGSGFSDYQALLEKNFSQVVNALGDVSGASVVGASSTNGILKFGIMFGLVNLATFMLGMYRSFWIERRYRFFFFVASCLLLSSAPIFVSPWFLFCATAYFWRKWV